MIHKNWLSLLLLGTLSLSVAACEKKDESTEDSVSESDSSEMASEMDAPTSEDMSASEGDTVSATEPDDIDGDSNTMDSGTEEPAEKISTTS